MSKYEDCPVCGDPYEPCACDLAKMGKGGKSIKDKLEEKKTKKSKEPEKKPMITMKYDPEAKRMLDKVRNTKNPTDYYKYMPSKYKGPEYRNPVKHMPSHPWQGAAIGKTGSGKTTYVIDLLNKARNFDRVYICAKCINEPLYQNFAASMGDKCMMTDSVWDLPSIEEMCERSKKDQICLIFDDQVAEDKKSQDKMFTYFLRGRKGIGNECGGISTMYITQSFTGMPKKIRDNLNLVILKHLPNADDKRAILKKLNNDIDEKEIFNAMYKKASKGGPDHGFIIDLTKPLNERYKLDWETAWDVNENNDDDSEEELPPTREVRSTNSIKERANAVKKSVRFSHSKPNNYSNMANEESNIDNTQNDLIGKFFPSFF